MVEVRASQDVAAIADDIVNLGYAVVARDYSARQAYDALFALGATFFGSSNQRKLACAMAPTANTGYTPVGIEYSTSPDVPDQKESITYVPAEASVATEHPLWVQPLYAAMRRCIDIAHPLSAAVMTALASRFGSNDPIYSPQHSQLALNCYPVGSAGRDVLIEPHEDGCLITVLSSTAPGLEIRLRSGEYVPCDVVVEHFVLLAGGTLSLATSGQVPPTFHRVVRAPDVAVRYTIAWDATADVARSIKPWSDPASDVEIDTEARMTLTRFGLAPLR